MPQKLFTIIVQKNLEDTLIDWLLERDDISGFTSLDAAGHGSSTVEMSALEKVRGRLNKVQIQIIIDDNLVLVLMKGLKEDFAQATLHYFITDVLESGRI